MARDSHRGCHRVVSTSGSHSSRRRNHNTRWRRQSLAPASGSPHDWGRVTQPVTVHVPTTLTEQERRSLTLDEQWLVVNERLLASGCRTMCEGRRGNTGRCFNPWRFEVSGQRVCGVHRPQIPVAVVMEIEALLERAEARIAAASALHYRVVMYELCEDDSCTKQHTKSAVDGCYEHPDVVSSDWCHECEDTSGDGPDFAWPCPTALALGLANLIPQEELDDQPTT